MKGKNPIQNRSRREFLKRAVTIGAGGTAVLVPVWTGLRFVLNPTGRETGGAGEFVRVASLQAVPNDNVPRKFPVITDRFDAWNKFPNVPIGAVYLRRVAVDQVEAYNAVCPHAGGFIDYLPDERCFLCPLHDSRFGLDGRVTDPKSPSPRGMDTLSVEIRNGEIWVRFQNFRAGTTKKLPA